MPKPNPHELYDDLTKEDEADLREYFNCAPCYELEGGIALVKKKILNLNMKTILSRMKKNLNKIFNQSIFQPINLYYLLFFCLNICLNDFC